MWAGARARNVALKKKKKLPPQHDPVTINIMLLLFRVPHIDQRDKQVQSA